MDASAPPVSPEQFWNPEEEWQSASLPPSYQIFGGAINRLWSKLSPYGQTRMAQIGMPMDILWGKGVKWEKGEPSTRGYWDPKAPVARQMAIWSGVIDQDPVKIIAHELAHAVQSEMWKPSTPGEFYSQLTPEERLYYGRATFLQRWLPRWFPTAAQKPWELYAAWAEWPTLIRPELRRWYPQYRITFGGQ